MAAVKPRLTAPPAPSTGRPRTPRPPTSLHGAEATLGPRLVEGHGRAACAVARITHATPRRAAPPDPGHDSGHDGGAMASLPAVRC